MSRKECEGRIHRGIVEGGRRARKRRDGRRWMKGDSEIGGNEARRTNGIIGKGWIGNNERRGRVKKVYGARRDR